MTRRFNIRAVAAGGALTLVALIAAFPFLWMIATSFKTLPETVSSPPAFLPTHPTWDAYRRLFDELSYARYLANTLILVAIGYVGLVLMAMAGYGFAKYRFRGRGPLFMLVLATMMVPAQVTMIPTYLILNFAHLTNTITGMALPGLVVAFNIFLLTQFMSTIPDEVLEAARIDGAGELRIFLQIVLPLSRPILAVQAILTFIAGWNSFLWPLIVANDESKYTLSVGLSLLNRQTTVDPPLQMAGASLMVIPIVIVFLLFQRHIVRGFTLSGLK
ncbi:MAG: multiple sugar transport system permease protein [Frankiales bacterium]|nr:multiple sugar transport system permease protein [Frankiales bacterium]